MSSPETFFITGANGQVGFEVRRLLPLWGQVLAPTRQELDLSDTEAVESWLREHRPTCIVNAAAYTAVDQAETDREGAQRLNAELPERLARYAAERNAVLVHYSSDYVYPGDGETPRDEQSATGPLGVYGQTKLAGDEAVQNSGAEHLIFRTSWVYSARGGNFMKTMLRLGREREALSIVDDQVGSPTPARLIAQITELALRSRIASGLYHLAPRGATSWHGFATEIFKLAREAGEPLGVTEDRVAAIPTSAFPTPAQRPLNSRLSVSKLEKTLGIELPGWSDQLALTLQEHLG